MLQRIYGTAFSNKKELKQYLFQLEEAKKEIIVKLKELQLFSLEDIGGGLVLGISRCCIRNVIEDHWRQEHQKWLPNCIFSAYR